MSTMTPLDTLRRERDVETERLRAAVDAAPSARGDADRQTDTISRDAAAHVLWHYRRPGVRPPYHIASLLKTIAVSPSSAQDLLALGWPGLVAAMRLAQAEDGLDRLAAIAKERRRG